ncbi:hypothetical protein ACLB2K_019739 [Fragaria x ananassa]
MSPWLHEEVLHEEMMKSVKYMVEELVRKSKVVLYQGQFDMKCGMVANEAWVRIMKWEGIEAGHLVPADQPL